MPTYITPPERLHQWPPDSSPEPEQPAIHARITGPRAAELRERIAGMAGAMGLDAWRIEDAARQLETNHGR